MLWSHGVVHLMEALWDANLYDILCRNDKGGDTGNLFLEHTESDTAARVLQHHIGATPRSRATVFVKAARNVVFGPAPRDACVEYILSQELHQRQLHFAYLAEFSAQCTQCIGRTLELTPGYVVQCLGLAFDLQSVATLHELKPTRKKMLQSECLEPSWHKHPLKFELGFKSRADLVEWRRRSAPDLPFYNHIMSKRIEIGVWRTNQQNYAKQANSRIDNDSEDDEWE
jgi:hypothetical protein